MQGFISLHRKILNWEWYDEPNTFKMFIHCLLRANHKDSSWRGEDIKRGQFITSLSHLATETGLSVKQVRTALKNLEQNTPIIYIFSKGDPDIIDSVEMQSNIKGLKKNLTNLSSNGSPEIYVTSMFKIFSILRAFSSGIAKLSPNRNLIEQNLREFCSLTGSSLVLLLSSDGLVLAEHFTPEAMKITNMQNSEELINVFEVVAPQFTTLFKIFYKFKLSEKEEAIFRVSDSVILFKRVEIVNYELYILFLIDNESKKDIINQHLQEFLNRTQDLLLRYIS